MGQLIGRNGKGVGWEMVPMRKKPLVIAHDGGRYEAYGSFTSEEKAREFIQKIWEAVAPPCGEWLAEEDELKGAVLKCSNCARVFEKREEEKLRGWTYCPHCGARMEGQE